MGIGLNDFTRTRLTHSLEAAQIGTGICSFVSKTNPELGQYLGLDEHLIESICLAHDIGHPPYGHGGEKALHIKMKDYGGFEGNGQTFRILTKLESYSENCGMNLSRRALLGVLKYPNFMSILSQTHSPEQLLPPPKALFDCDREVFDWVLEPLSLEDKSLFMTFDMTSNAHYKTIHKSIDCSIMELADDIAYAIHDLEDAIVIGLIHREQFNQEVSALVKQSTPCWLSNKIDDIEARLFSGVDFQRKNTIGSLVNFFITSISLEQKHLFKEPLLDYVARIPPETMEMLNLFKHFVLKNVIKKPELQLIEFKGQKIISSLFDAFFSEPERLLPSTTRQRWLNEQGSMQVRVISDYIAGMTDDYANKVYRNLYIP